MRIPKGARLLRACAVRVLLSLSLCVCVCVCVYLSYHTTRTTTAERRAEKPSQQ